MCVTFFTLSEPGFKLILAFNRDELLDRPTLSAHWHDFVGFSSSPNTPLTDDGRPYPVKNEKVKPLEIVGEGQGRVLSGRDWSSTVGGTWLGITKDLKVGMITNNPRTPPAPGVQSLKTPPSRGKLLRDFLSAAPQLTSPPGAAEYLTSHHPTSGIYEGFNLVLFSLAKPQPDIGYLTNRPQPFTFSGLNRIQDLAGPKGCIGLSNLPIDKKWPKVKEGEERMAKTLEEWKSASEGIDELIERMFSVLSANCGDLASPSKQVECDNDITMSTTVPPAKLGQNVLFNKDPTNTLTRWGGTRTATVIAITEKGEVVYVERDIWVLGDDGEPTRGTGERKFKFQGEISCS
nr:hypothetical protein L204_01385 [Cryptococcus depauperatus CBS 7855]